MTNLDERIERQKQLLLELQARVKKENRKQDARKKIIMGAAILRYAEELAPERRDQLMKALDPHVTRTSDRAFLGLKVSDNTAH